MAIAGARILGSLTLMLTLAGCQAQAAGPEYVATAAHTPAITLPPLPAAANDDTVAHAITLDRLQQAQQDMARHEPWKAIDHLTSITPPDDAGSATAQLTIRYWETLAEAYASNHQNLSAINTRLQLRQYLDTTQQSRNDTAIWHAAQRMTPSQRATALAKLPEGDTTPATPLLRGWLSLAQLEQDAANQQPNWRQGLHAWLHTYPNHPGKTQIHLDALDQPQSPFQTIALLLPQSGSLGQAGKAITQGFLTAYYAHPQTRVMIIDTAEGDILTHYQTALTRGADVVVGPLRKSQIQQLTDAKAFRVPTLVLNNLDKPIVTEHATVMQFGLSPLDEAQQIAQHALQHHLLRVMVISPDNAWGNQLSQRFQRYWQKVGGQTVEAIHFDPTHHDQQLGSAIQRSLGIVASTNRIQHLQKTLKTRVSSRPRMRSDVDWVLLLTTAQQAQQIYPLLKFYYLDQRPTYGLAQIDPGYALSPNFYRDLQGIIIPTTHWHMGQHLSAPFDVWRRTIAQTWPTSFKHDPALYALGIDSALITREWAALTLFAHHPLQGASGVLERTPCSHIHRGMVWGRIHPERAGHAVQWLQQG